MDGPGPLGRTVTDVAVLLGAMTGLDENDPATQQAAGKAGMDYTQFLDPRRAAGMRLGIVDMDEAAIEAVVAKLAQDAESVAKWRREIHQWRDRVQEQSKVFAALGVILVEVPAAAVPDEPPVMAVIEYAFRDVLNRFLAGLGEEAPVTSLAEIVAINAEDPANRAPYGQGHLEAAQHCAMTADDYAAQATTNRAVGERLGALFSEYNLDALVSRSEAYAAAGFPALSVPAGYDASGQPVDVTLLGDFLGEDRLITLGYAYEQATRARLTPDLERTVAAIGAVVRGRSEG
jgi:amidase